MIIVLFSNSCSLFFFFFNQPVYKISIVLKELTKQFLYDLSYKLVVYIVFQKITSKYHRKLDALHSVCKRFLKSLHRKMCQLFMLTIKIERDEQFCVSKEWKREKKNAIRDDCSLKMHSRDLIESKKFRRPKLCDFSGPRFDIFQLKSRVHIYTFCVCSHVKRLYSFSVLYIVSRKITR